MAALCPGVQYGLSSQANFGENKDLVFVKLTDSALRTIEDYVRNQTKFNKGPTIKFLGNEGQLYFPSQHNGGTSFSFSLSSTSEMERTGAPFECLQQYQRSSLCRLGPISHKICIQANDDVYEMTKQRVTVAEENHKNKCAREIKMNQSDIGRKVKVKQTGARPVIPPRREPPTSMRDSLLKQQYPTSNINVAPSSKSSPSTLPNLHSTNGGGGGNLSNGLGSNLVSSSKPQNKPSIPDIARRPIRERMIHLLALRPFKKPELYERLTREGLREKNLMTSVLKQIACLRDNSYHLNRAMWNDVHDDWPFYTESERQMLKRRKPQNLTPPGSSDGGSSGSGHSPTSTHPGSPPPPTVTSSTKRPGYYDGADGLQTKKPRISHFKRPPLEQNTTYPLQPQQQLQQQHPPLSQHPPTQHPPPQHPPPQHPPPSQHRSSPLPMSLSVDSNNSQRRPVTDSRDASNMNPRSRESPPPIAQPPPSMMLLNDDDDYHHHHPQHHQTSSYHQHHQNPPPQPQVTPTRKRPADSHASFGSTQRGEKTLGTISKSPPAIKETSLHTNGVSHSNGARTPSKQERYRVSSSTANSRVARVSPDSQTIDPPSAPSTLDEPEFPDYVKEYTSIRDMSQRKRYKSDFNADYAEYKELHAIVEKVSRRFAELEERLKQEDSSSSKYKEIKKQIVREYHQNKKDLDQQKSKRRFQYLYDKLSHIKRLVCEYDQGLTDGGGGGVAGDIHY